MSRLLAISDLHLGHPANRAAIATIGRHPDDELIVAGDVGETLDHLRRAFDELLPRFAALYWVPGNHELWSVPSEPAELRGEAKYRALVAVCREYGVLTPEDPYRTWGVGEQAHVVAPLHLLYDYSFRPDGLTAEGALDWARETGVVCADESYLHPDPHPSRAAWCAALCDRAERRLSEIDRGLPTVLVNHYPLREEHAVLPRVPRFKIWCGTRRTADWHRRFRAAAVVHGHLHIRRSRRLDGTRFEEVSLGYPRDWDARRGIEPYLRTILPRAAAEAAPPPPRRVAPGRPPS